MLNLMTSCLVAYWAFKHFYSYTANLSSVDTENKITTVISRMNSDSSFNLHLFIALLTGAQFARLVFAMKVSRVFGPMVKILGSMLLDLVTFMFLYILIFLIFA